MLLRPTVELFFGKSGTGKTRLALSRIGPARAILYDLNIQDTLARNAVVCETATALVEAMRGTARRICWRGFQAMGEGAFEFANMAAWECGGFALFWDEVDQLMDVRRPTPPWAYRIINAGRHRDLTIYATARRPASMPRHLTAAATAAYSYTVTGARDVAYLAEFFGRDAARALPQLPRGDAYIWTEDGCSRKNIFKG